MMNTKVTATPMMIARSSGPGHRSAIQACNTQLERDTRCYKHTISIGPAAPESQRRKKPTIFTRNDAGQTYDHV